MGSEEHSDTGMDLGGDEELKADPFADVPADAGDGEEAVEGGLGGDGATLEDLAEEEGAPSPEPINGDEGDPAPLPGEGEPEPEPVADEPEPAPEPEGQDDQAEKAKPASKKAGTTERPYQVLVEIEAGHWQEALDGPIQAANGDVALREAYAALVPAESADPKTLVVIPVHYWKPREVKAKTKISRAVEIG